MGTTLKAGDMVRLPGFFRGNVMYRGMVLKVIPSTLPHAFADEVWILLNDDVRETDETADSVIEVYATVVEPDPDWKEAQA